MEIDIDKTKPDPENVIWGERDISFPGMSESEIAMEGIGRKFQKPTVCKTQMVRESLAVALKTPRGRFAVLMYNSSAQNAAQIEENAEEFGLTDSLTCIAEELSRGNNRCGAGEHHRHSEESHQTSAVVVVEYKMERVRRRACKVTLPHEVVVLAEGSLDHVTSKQKVIDVYRGRGHA
ncbi:hypothetical protein ROLI_011260 [Roseobacter fucihabitans]|uniref:Uncharacterized protein n=1 Tax=Roseobacter fucihabitans TaxID=1537242 RepID=A0ABZ2BQ25_9RHOB|nr:hypothetical protein [Roseobacter litoralis]